jgi:hypothetical protein
VATNTTLRPTVPLLPHQCRRHERSGDNGCRPQHRPAHQRPRTHHCHRQRQHNAQQENLELRQGGDVHDNTEREQQAVVTQPDPPDQQPDHKQPLDRFEGVGRQPVSEQRRPHTRRLRRGGQSLCAPVAAEFAGDEGGNDDRTGGGQHGGYTQRDQRRHKGRLISRSPIEVISADGQHVHLVEPVAATECACYAMQYGGHRRDRENRSCGER